MEPLSSVRPRVSRETRRLLAIVFISLSLLWVLARLRFTEEAIPSIPVPPMLSQLVPQSTFDDLAFAVSQLDARLTPSLLPIELLNEAAVLPGLRIRDDLAIALTRNAPFEELIARDAVTALAVVRVEGTDAPPLIPWVPRRLNYPRYLFAAEASHEGISLRPVFVASLHAITTPSWPGSIWMPPAQTALSPGTFVFTTDGTFAGLVIDRDGRPAVVPGSTVIDRAQRLMEDPHREPARLGISVQALNPALSSALSAPSGVVVTSVDPAGPAHDQLAVAEVIESVDDEPMSTLEHWQARVNRLDAGESIDLRVRGRTGERDVRLTALADDPQLRPALPLGLTMRAVRGGAEVVRVLPATAAARAGLAAGDLITLIDDVRAPTPLQVSRAFGSAPDDRAVIVAIARAGTHHVLALQKR